MKSLGAGFGRRGLCSYRPCVSAARLRDRPRVQTLTAERRVEYTRRMAETKNVRIQVLLTPSELDAMRKLADRQTRSVAYVGREFILAGLKRAGVKPARVFK